MLILVGHSLSVALWAALQFTDFSAMWIHDSLAMQSTQICVLVAWFLMQMAHELEALGPLCHLCLNPWHFVHCLVNPAMM